MFWCWKQVPRCLPCAVRVLACVLDSAVCSITVACLEVCHCVMHDGMHAQTSRCHLTFCLLLCGGHSWLVGMHLPVS